MKNIIFDLGGVVIDWNPEKVKKEYRHNPALPAFLFGSGFFQSQWSLFDRGEIDIHTLIEQMAELSGVSTADCRDFMEYIKHSLVDIPETVELIRQLSEKGYRLYCLSNMSVEFYDYLKSREFFSHFDGQVISTLEKMIKPEPEIYRILTDRFGLNPQESLFIDDLKPNIEAAAAQGYRTVHFADRGKGYAEIRQILSL